MSLTAICGASPAWVNTADNTSRARHIRRLITLAGQQALSVCIDLGATVDALRPRGCVCLTSIRAVKERWPMRKTIPLMRGTIYYMYYAG